jgi:hypothetical protein
MADYLASADAGNGGTNVVLKPNGSRYKAHYEPSVRAMATGDSLGLGEQFEMSYEWVDWYGSRYVTGDDVVRVTKRALERHMGSGRYGEEFTRFFTAVSLAKLGVKSGTIDLTLFAPPGMYGEAKQKIMEGFTGEYSYIKIRLKGDKKPREWTYSNVTVIPEGIGAAACFMFDDNGQPVDSDIFQGRVVILDIGAYTLDALLMEDGNFNPESLEHATWENQGVNTHLREPILRQIHKQGDDFTVVTVDDVDILLRKGLNTGGYTLTVAGYELNLEPLAQNYFERYADWIGNNICDGVFNGFRGIKSVILVGGGAVMAGDKLRDLYPDKVLDPSKLPQTRKIHPADMNAVGGLRLALVRTQQGG